MTDVRPDDIKLEINRLEPTAVGELERPAVIGFGRLFGVLVTDSYYYVANVSDLELEIYDISTPATPTFVGNVAAVGVTGAMTNLAVSMVLDPGGNYLYIAMGNDKVFALDVNTDPEVPTIADTWTLTETASSSAVVTLDAANTRLYVLSGGGSKFYHSNISTPGTFASNGSISASNTVASCQHGVVTPDGDYVCYPSGTLASPAQLGFIDVSTPATPTEGTPIALPATIEDSIQITPTNSVFFANTTQLGIIANATDENGLRFYFWLLYNKGADWEAATIVSHDEVASEISPLKNASACHGRLRVTEFPEIPVFSSAQASATYLYVPIQNSENYLNGRLAIYDFPADATDPPQPRSSFEYSNLGALGSLAVTSAGTIASIGLRPGGTPQVIVTLSEPAGLTDITAYLLTDVAAKWGIRGGGPADRVADTGTLDFELDNSEFNSTSEIGKFSPDHANLLAQFSVGRSIKLTITHGANSIVWQGVIWSITPTAGLHGQRRTRVKCVDYMDYLSRSRIRGLPLEFDLAAGVAFLRLVSRLEAQPPLFNLELTANDVYEFAFDNMISELTSVVTEVQRICNSDRSFVYVDNGKLTYEQRTTRAAQLLIGPEATLTDANILDLEIEHSASNIYNSAQVKVFPRRQDASPAVLFTLASTPSILRNNEITFDAPYSDAAQLAQRVAGRDIVTPVVTTDYTFNSAADGTGVDYSAQISVVINKGGNSSTVVVKNTGARDGFLTFFRLRGTGVYTFEPVVVTNEDTSSQGKYGPSDLTYSMPYHTQTPVAEDAAEYLVSIYSTPRTFVRGVTIPLNDSALLADFVAGNIRVGSMLRITETVTGLSSSDHFVHSIDLSISNRQFITARLGLIPAVNDDVWILQTAGFTELGTTTTLASSFTA